MRLPKRLRKLGGDWLELQFRKRWALINGKPAPESRPALEDEAGWLAVARYNDWAAGELKKINAGEIPQWLKNQEPGVLR